MRKINFWATMALLVFVFMSGGCGGSASSDSEKTGAEYHETVSTFMTGEWYAPSGSVNNISGTVETSTAYKLDNFENFKLSFKDIEFGSDSKTASGKGKVYYSFSCTAGNSPEIINITSYPSSATSIYKEMNLTRFSDTQWVFSDSTSTVSLEFVGQNINVKINGRGNFADLGSNLDYTVECVVSKNSTTPITDSDPTSTTLHEKIATLLTGQWTFDETSGYTGKATSTKDGNTVNITLGNVTNFKMIFSDITFASDSDESAGSGNVYYSHVSNASYGDISETFSIKSYEAGASTKTQNMTLTRVSDTQWTFSSSSVSIIINLSSLTTGRMTVQMTGTAYLSDLGASCNYTIQGTLVKTSTSTEIDDDSSDSGTDGGEMTGIAEILNGTWKLINETSATATSTTLGSDKVLELRLASNTNIEISEISPDVIGSQTGTAFVKYSQTWRAFYVTDETHNPESLAAGEFTFSKNERMKIAKTPDNAKWRIEDINNNGAKEDEYINLTVISNTEISTEWHGLTTTLDDGDTYYYEITSSYRKQ